MKKYTFEELSDIEFEDFVNDLLSCAYDWEIESFKPGRDFGIDGRSSTVNGTIIIQSKHYRKSGIDKLLREIALKEALKAKEINPERYIFVTSLNLSPDNKDKIKSAFSGINLDVSDIIGNDDLNALLRRNQDILIRWYKLWSESSNVLQLFLQPAIKSREIILLSRLNKINKFFVITEDIGPALSALNNEHVVVLSGEPGVGKTTLAEYLCQIHMKNGYTVEIIEGDITNHPFNFSNPEEKTIYYFDDFLGSNYFSFISGSQDNNIVNIIEHLKNEPNKKLVLTSRTNIINKAEMMSQSYRSFKLTSRQYIVNINNYSRITKAKILYNHLWHSPLPLEFKEEIINNGFYNKIINHRNFNPRLIAFTMNLENENNKSLSQFVYDNLEHPDQIWDHCYTVQLDEQARILVKICIAAGGRISEPELERAYEQGLVEFHFTSTTNQPKDFYHTSRLVCDSILLRHKSDDLIFYTHFNPSVTDYIIDKISSPSEAKKLINSLNNGSVIKFYSDLIKSNKIKMHDTNEISDFMLEKFSNKLDQNFISALDLGMRVLNIDNVTLAKAIFLFNKIKTLSPSGLSSDTLSNILGLGFDLGVNIDTYIYLISLGIFNTGELEYIYRCIKDDAIFSSIQDHLRVALREQLESDINYIIRNTDGFYECYSEKKLESFASSVIDNISLEYELLTSDDFDLINEYVSIAELIDDINEHTNYDDYHDQVEQEAPPKIHSHIRNEQDEIDYIFKKFNS
ncbi:restriction endonuclease [Aeromonas media]|uniref:Restriction endonuclease n=1 Tax=Aeromonas media TaxID=651 RepID=A0AAP6GA13_AERME|nr:restriction endonuclease [Aeromonas media]MDX7921348.1 restriction endonuclease [Aeromonas media]